MNIENLVFKYKDGSLDAVIIKVELNEAMKEFYSKYAMREICFGIETTVRNKFKHKLHGFRVECTYIDNGFDYVVFKHSEVGLDDLLKAELLGAVVEVVEMFRFKIKIQYLEGKNAKKR